jgi:hypothetical protein
LYTGQILLEVFVFVTSLVGRMLLILAGDTETNPGPFADADNQSVDDWEFSEASTKEEQYRTNRTKCGVCGVGQIKPVF